jgi:hypothetical protein
MTREEIAATVPMTSAATVPDFIPPEPVSGPSKGEDPRVGVAVDCEDFVMLASTATPRAKPSYGYANA